jgi:hypothetical protein
VLDKYRIPYLFSLTDHRVALERACSTPHRIAVPGHGAVLEDGALAALVEHNAGLAWQVMDAVLDLAGTPQTAEALLGGLLQRLGAEVNDAPSFYLLQPTIFAFLGHLHRQDLVTHEVHDWQSLWRRT